MNKRLKTALMLYDALWHAATPALRLNPRLKDGYDQRKLNAPLPHADLWVQAASGGEAYLAWSLVKQCRPCSPIRILATTNTRQGLDILEKAAKDVNNSHAGITLMPAWFPFDRPDIMDRAVGQTAPRLMILLETEIWPGLLNALKKQNRPVWIVNGRITDKSFSRYMKWRPLLRPLGPDGIMAISDEDAQRFGRLFGSDIVSTMSNIKFDGLSAAVKPDTLKRLTDIIPMDGLFLVLGSIRQEEEPQIEKIIEHIRERSPNVITGLFPRHLHRLGHWRETLSKMGIDWNLRSKIKGPAKPGQTILWDTFGELSGAYAAASAVFVGGSLAPLGGQNFLEPLVYGVKPVIGPYWDNFFWVGDEIFDQKLVLREETWGDVAARLLQQLTDPPDKDGTKRQASQYIHSRQGGTAQVIRMVARYIPCTPMEEA